MHEAEARDDYLAGELARHDERLDSHEQQFEAMKQMMCAQVGQAMEQAIMRAVSNPQLWQNARKAISTQAKVSAGGWLLGSIGALFSRAGLVLAGLVALYAVGGPAALIGALKAWLAGGHS